DREVTAAGEQGEILPSPLVEVRDLADECDLHAGLRSVALHAPWALAIAVRDDQRLPRVEREVPRDHVAGGRRGEHDAGRCREQARELRTVALDEGIRIV